MNRSSELGAAPRRSARPPRPRSIQTLREAPNCPTAIGISPSSPPATKSPSSWFSAGAKVLTAVQQLCLRERDPGADRDRGKSDVWKLGLKTEINHMKVWDKIVAKKDRQAKQNDWRKPKLVFPILIARARKVNKPIARGGPAAALSLLQLPCHLIRADPSSSTPPNRFHHSKYLPARCGLDTIDTLSVLLTAR